MRAVGIKAFGGPEVLEMMTLGDPEPGPGDVRVKVMFAGVNHIDVHVRRGDFRGADRPPLEPLVLGYEGAGEVDAVGAGVTAIEPGARVAWCCVPGSHAERMVVPAWRLVPVPASVPLDIACALQLDGALAHALTVSAFPVRADDWLMVQGGAEVVSQLVIQVAKAQGARVIAIVRREVDAAVPRAVGADLTIVATDGGRVVEQVREATGGQGCHAVLDGVGRDTIATSIACCRRRGVVVLYGAVSGAVDAIRPDDLAAAGSIFLTRLHLPDYMQDAAEVRWRSGDLLDAWQAGQLRFDVGRILPLDGAREAHRALEGPTATGKILLKLAG
ncbi:MAG: quinone oxidoreductase [Hyphomicrobiaceae bacterium]|nr:quinone oxidoreductase [Hyphomicrobiaceae bacterium]